MCAVALLMAACGAVAGPVADPSWGHHHHHHGHGGGYGGIQSMIYFNTGTMAHCVTTPLFLVSGYGNYGSFIHIHLIDWW